MTLGATIGGISWILPERVETNEELVAQFGTWTPKKIFSKTGVHKRHVVSDGETVSVMAARAGKKFFEEHPHVDPASIDMLVLCTELPDYILPATACLVHHELGLRKSCGAFDYNLGCSGYSYGLAICKGFITSGLARRVLLLTGDLITRYINKNDKATRTIFGDGFTATLIEASEVDRIGPFDFGTDGSGAAQLIIEAGGAACPRTAETAVEVTNRFGNSRSKNDLFMDGPSVLDFALREEPEALGRLLDQAGLTFDTVDLVVFHQATQMMLERLRDALGIDHDKFVIALEDKGNTASSTIPIALAECVASGRLKPGMKVLISGFGVGLSWGSTIITWH